MSLRLRELPHDAARIASDGLASDKMVLALKRGDRWRVVAIDPDDADSLASYETLGYIQVNDSPILAEGTRFIHLQGLGKQAARMVRELKAGDLLSWNYTPRGYEVLSVEPVSAHFMRVVTRDVKTGKEFIQKLKRDKLVAVTRPKEDAD